MPTLDDLLADPDARLVQVARGTYLDENGDLQTEWVADDDWSDPPGGPAGQHIPALLDTEISIAQRFDPLDPFATVSDFPADIILINDMGDYAGRFDGVRRWSVDARPWTLFIVGHFADGTRLELADVEDDPWRELLGIDKPEGGESTVIIRAREDLKDLMRPLQPETYRPFCLEFPGTALGSVNFGDVLDQTGSFAVSIWFWTTSLTTGQYLLHKDSGTTGWSIAVGAVGVDGAAQVICRGQTPVATTTAANVLRARFDHRLDISVDVAAGTREIRLDGAVLVTTTGVTGSPTNSTTNLTLGSSFAGRISRVVFWSAARTNALQLAEARIPFLGSEAGLAELLLEREAGVGTTVVGKKTGSTVSGTLGTGVAWTTATWHYLTNHRPYVVGRAWDVPVRWIDPPQQIGEVCYGGCSLIQVLRSNHATVSTANYTTDLLRGLLTVTTGSLSGSYSADVLNNPIWGTALMFGATSTAVATTNSPTGSRTMWAHVRLDSTSVVIRYVAGWQNGALAGTFVIRTSNTGANLPQVVVINDAATVFTLTGTVPLIEGRRYFIAARLTVTGGTGVLDLRVDGTIVATMAVSGAWTTVRPTFGVGIKPDTLTLPWIGIIDEPGVAAAALTDANLDALWLLPATGSESGSFLGYHCNDATSPTAPTTAASYSAGKPALTLTNVTWGTGRHAPADNARAILRESGFVDADLDAASFREFLADFPYDTGWFLEDGEKALDVLHAFIAAFSWRWEKRGDTIFLQGFSGLSGVAEETFGVETAILSEEEAPIEPVPCEPAVWDWQLEGNHNWTELQAESVAASLLTSDPARYVHAQEAFELGGAKDASVRFTAAGAPGRFPDAIEKRRPTPLLYRRDMETWGAQLLATHRHGATPIRLSIEMTLAQARMLREIAVDMEEVEADQTTIVIIELAWADGVAQILGWRPAP